MPSIGVLEHNQNPTDKPSRRIKKAGGQSLVNRGLATWVKENVLLQMRASSIPQSCANSMTTCLQYAPNATAGCRRARYIPAKLPSHKLPGTMVTGPVVEKSRLGIFRIMQANHLGRQQTTA